MTGEPMVAYMETPDMIKRRLDREIEALRQEIDDLGHAISLVGPAAHSLAGIPNMIGSSPWSRRKAEMARDLHGRLLRYVGGLESRRSRCVANLRRLEEQRARIR